MGISLESITKKIGSQEKKFALGVVVRRGWAVSPGRNASGGSALLRPLKPSLSLSLSLIPLPLGF